MRGTYTFRDEDYIKAHILCAKHEEDGRTLCRGDSGGPLTVKKDGHHVLVGVNAAGYGCGAVSFALIPGL